MSEAIWHRAQQESTQAGQDVSEVLAAVHSVALELLESVSRPPERLLVRAADVEVELDWRVPEVRHQRDLPYTGESPYTGELPYAGGQPVAAETIAAVGRPSEALAAVPDPTPGQHYVCAPSVGTFYRAAEPGADPFVVEDALVRPGQTVGIVEAMKLMLPVDADRAGRIVEVLVKDGSSVEFGERLFLVEDVES